MSHENGNATFLAPSPDVDVQNPIKRSKISYTREFLLSLDKADSTVKLPMEAKLSISCVVDDASGLLTTPPVCIPDSRCKKSESQFFLLKVPDGVNQLLHRSNEPYRPPCRYKALPSSIRDSSDLLQKGGMSGSSEGTNKEKAERERWRKDAVSAAKEDKRHSKKNNDFKDSQEEFLMSPATTNPNTLQFTSNVISKRLDASCKASQIEGAARGDAGLPSTPPKSTKNCSIQCQQVQGLTTNGTVNPWLKTVNHIDTSWHLMSMLDNAMHFLESDGSARVMEFPKESRSPSFLNQEDCGNHKNLAELHLSNASDCVHDSADRIAISDCSEASITPASVVKEKQVVSTVDDYCKGISMKRNPSSPDSQVQQEMELNSFSSSSSLDGESNSSSELCLPDEDSLIAFDEPFWLPDVENSAVVDSSMSNSPERNPIKTDVFSPSSRDMIEKLVEFILNDESSPTPTHVDDPIVHHGAGLGGSFHTMHAQQQPHTQFCSNQLNRGWDQQNHNSSQTNSFDSAICSYFSHSFPFNTFSQDYGDELRRFDHEASQSTFQQVINPGKLHLCSLCVSQSGVPPLLPHLQMASCTHKINSMQNCTFGYQEPNYRDFIRPNPGFHDDSNINQAVVDSSVGMKLQASRWQPHVGGF